MHVPGHLHQARLIDDEPEGRPVYDQQAAINILRLIWNRRRALQYAVIAAAVLATLYLRFGPYTYAADALIRLDFAASGSANGSPPRVSLDTSSMVESEARMMRSRALTEQVVSRLHLDASFAGPPGLLASVIGLLKRSSEESTGRAATPQHSEAFERAVERVMANTAIDYNARSYLLAINVRWPSASDAAKIANTVAQEYLRARQVQNLMATKAKMIAEVSQLGLRLGDKFPTYVAARAQIDEIDRRIDAARRTDVPLQSIALGDFTADIAIPAQTPRAPASPNPKVVYLVAIVGGLGLALLLLILRERYDTRVSNEWTLAQRLALRCFGAVPDGRGLRASGRAALREAVRSIAVTTGLVVKGPACQLVVVTSSLPDEGKSLFVSTLAEVVAEQGRRVLLIDAVPRVLSRREAERVRESAAKDGAMFIANDETAPYLIVGTPDGRLMTRGKEFDDYLAAARSEYDLIVIKAPPVLMLSDAALLARSADVLMLLVHWRKTAAQTAAEAVRRLQDAGVRVSGTVLSNVNLRRQAGTAAHDQSYYLARYGKFYASISSCH